MQFEKLRSDMLVKMKLPSGQEDIPQTLGKERLGLISQIYTEIRFILTRFGRVINLFEALHGIYKKKKESGQLKSKQPPAIRKIQQIESIFQSESIFAGLGGSPCISLRSADNISLPEIYSPISSHSSDTLSRSLQQHANEKILNEPAPRQLVDLKKVFYELSDRAKHTCIEKYLKLVAIKWKEDYEEERKTSVPLIVCRMCSQKFYADKEKEHSQFCIEKINKTKEIPQINQKFLELSNLLTEQMVNIEKINACQTPMILPMSNQKVVQTLLNTPTLKRRAPLNQLLPDSSLGIGQKLPKTDLINGIEKIAEQLHSSESSGDEERKALKNPLPMIPEQKAQQTQKLQQIPLIPLNKLDQQTQPQPSIVNTQNPLLLYSQKSSIQIIQSNQKQAATAVRSILKMSEFGGVSKPQPTGLGMIQPIQRKEEIKAFEVPQVAIKDDVPTNIDISSINKVEEKEIEELKAIEKSNIVATTSQNIMPQPLKKAPIIPNPLQKLASSLRSFEKPTLAPIVTSIIDPSIQTKETQAMVIKPLESDALVKHPDEEGKKEKQPIQVKINVIDHLKAPEKPQVIPPSSQISLLQRHGQGKVQKDEITQKIPMSSKNAYSNALGFFKAQKTEEKKTKESSKFVQEQKKGEILSVNESPTKNQQNISLIQLPTSPYLQNVNRKIEMPSSFQIFAQPTQIENYDKEIKTNQQSQPTIRSPYIGLNASNEQRKQHIQNLKKHMQDVMTRGTVQADLNKTKSIKETFRITPISNAFSVEIKNQREEALKNMEHLRQSVKLKKRANPLEKIMNKLISNDNIIQGTFDVPKTPKLSNGSEQSKQDINSINLLQQLKPKSMLNQPSGQLQKIEEAADEDGNLGDKNAVSFKNDELQVSNKPKQAPVAKKLSKTMVGMSPIISFRALNRMALNNGGQYQSQSNSVMNTPLMSSTDKLGHDSNSSLSSHKNQGQWFEEESKIEEVIRNLQSAKQELEILETLKTLSLEIFNMINHVKQSQQKKMMLEKYLGQLEIVNQGQDFMGFKSSQLLQQFISLVKQQIEAINSLDKIEKRYKRTLPWIKQIDSDLDDNSKLSRRLNMSIQTREAPSQLVSSGLPAFRGHQQTPQLFSPLPFNSKPLNFQGIDLNSLGLTPRSQIQKLPASQTPMISSRNIRELPQININKGDNSSENQKSTFQTSFMRLQQMAQPSSASSRLIVPENGQDVKIPFAQSNQLSGNPSSQIGMVNLGAPRQKSQFSNTVKKAQQQPSNSSNRGMSSQSQITDESNKNEESSSSFYSSNSDDDDKQCDSKSPESKRSLFARPQVQISVEESHINNQEDKKDMLESQEDRQKDKVEQALDQLKQFSAKPPRIPRSISRNAGSQGIIGQYNNIKSKSFDGKFERSSTLQRKATNMEEIKEEAENQHSVEDKLESQSDIVIGQHFSLREGQEMLYDQQDERKTNSDMHEMFFVSELMKDDEKFNNLLQNKIAISQLNMQDEIDSDSESDDEEVLTMGRVRFSSLCNLPSQMECCSIDYQEKQKLTRQVSINDFILIKALSSGAYGKVILARKKNTDDFFAIKVLDKQKMMEKNVVEYVINEKNILSQMSNEFIVRGVYTFQSKKFLYMVMEFMKGGDLSSLLEQVGSFDEDTAKYYLAQIVLALEYLHSKGVIHRDLKPDNILIDSEGRIKLTDFGLSEAGIEKVKASAHQSNPAVKSQAQENLNLSSITDSLEQKELQEDIQKVLGHEKVALKQAQTQVTAKKKSDEEKKKMDSRGSGSQAQKQHDKKENRVLGTCHYMAPEVINGEENTPALDFWSFGVIVYEFLIGALPFSANSPLEVFERIKKRDIKYPTIGRGENELSPEAHSLIEALLTMDPKLRLGAQSINQIKNHPFFKGIKFDKIMEMDAPFKPLGRDQDTTYFPKANAEDEDIQTILNDKESILEKQVNKEFNKFDNVCYDTLQNINSKEATKAMVRAERMRKRKQQQQKLQQQPSSKELLLNESILFAPIDGGDKKQSTK